MSRKKKYRRQHSGGEASRRAKQEQEQNGGVDLQEGQPHSGLMPRNNIGAKGKGSQVSRSRKMRETKVISQARH